MLYIHAYTHIIHKLHKAFVVPSCHESFFRAVSNGSKGHFLCQFQFFLVTSFAGPGWKTFVPAGASPTVETVEKVDALRTADRNRAFDLTQCVVADVTNAAAYIVRAILQIRSAASACPEPKACAINIMKLG